MPTVNKTTVAQLMFGVAQLVDAVFDPGEVASLTSLSQAVNLDRLSPVSRAQLLDAVDKIRYGDIDSAERLHENWLKDREADGWVYGERLDRVTKTSPLLKPWDELTNNERIKSVASYQIAAWLAASDEIEYDLSAEEAA